MKILIFIDEISCSPTKDEQDTLIEALEIKEALNKMGHSTIIENFTLDLEKNLKLLDKIKPDLIFNLVETLAGSDTLHLPPLLFSKASIRYTGANAFSLFMTGDKVGEKHFFTSLNIPTPRYYSSNIEIVDPLLVNNEVIIKPKDGEASLGIDDKCVTTFKDETQLKTYVKNHPNLFIEQYIKGREFSVSVLKINKQIVSMPIAEMEFINFPEDKPKILNYKSKWDEASFEYKNTQRTFKIDNSDIYLVEQLKQLSIKCYKHLGSKGYMRVDFRVDENNSPYVLEVNMNPCITHDSGFVASAKEYGLSQGQLIKYIITEAIDD